MRTTVLIVDDHAGFRRSARRMLEADGYEVVGEAQDGSSALAQLSAGMVVLAALFVALARRWRAADDAGGRRLAPMVVAGGAAAALVVPILVTAAAGLPEEVVDTVGNVSLIPMACVPFAFLGGLLRSRLARAEAVSHLVGRLGDATDLGWPLCVGDALAEALDRAPAADDHRRVLTVLLYLREAGGTGAGQR